ncbi:mitochondrial inner membrane protease subunit [Xylariales sp. PMI_506]|nr:mitochondrial inner membrane protease subunit [Xylariales sp. PMI_506]
MPFLGHPLRLTVATGKAFFLLHLFWTHGYSVGAGQGPSMIPTFLVTGEYVVVSKHHRRGRGIQVGDCVDYDIPVEPGSEGVKRVIGMPGDYVLLNSPGARNDDMLQASLLASFPVCPLTFPVVLRFL